MGDRLWPFSNGKKGVRSARAKRGAKRRAALLGRVGEVITHEAFVPNVLIGLVLTLVLTLVVGTARESELGVAGRAARETRVVRLNFTQKDAEATQREQELVERNAPLVFQKDELAWEELEQSLKTLPAALAVAESLDEVAPEYRDPFALTPEQFDVIREVGAEPGTLSSWERRINSLLGRLAEHPFITTEDYQRALGTGTDTLLLLDGAQKQKVNKDWALAIETTSESKLEELTAELTRMTARAGLYAEQGQVVVQRLLGTPTFRYDDNLTTAERTEASASVAAVERSYAAGELIYQHGEILDDAMLELSRTERERFFGSVGARGRFVSWLGLAGLIAVLVFGAGTYLCVYYPRAAKKAWRMAAIAALLGGAAGVACLGVAWSPDMLWIGATAPVVFVGMMLVVAYDVRLALATGAMLGAVVALGLGLSIAELGVLIAGVGVASWQLADIRNRSDVVRAGVVTSIVLAIGSMIVITVSKPVDLILATESAADVLQAGGGGFLAGALTLVILPSVERMFDIVTGMTLTEWRDPRQPLLRELQAHAPGTFNHSHTVATLAEAAADAIGADSLHLYVGALYHDVGKMNKPEYFVENQSGGRSKHTKLSPAMSLLVIVGHVKDGVELAREYGVPRSLQQYIETHHGTTLVEYFYDQAKRRAEEDDDVETPDEIEYRYPGPKPRTKEQAVLMICDAVESATRAMAEPTPSRIGALVHSMTHRRLMDGQFDRSNLTLGELRKIEEAVTKSLCAIYHGRIAYPGADKDKKQQSDKADPKVGGARA